MYTATTINLPTRDFLHDKTDPAHMGSGLLRTLGDKPSQALARPLQRFFFFVTVFSFFFFFAEAPPLGWAGEG